MAIPITTFSQTTLDGSTPSSILSGLKTILEGQGWTVSWVGLRMLVKMVGLFADGETLTLGATVYRFKDTMTQAYDVKRASGDVPTTVHNLIHAINADGTAGVEYYTGTNAHPSVSAVVSTNPNDTSAFWLTMLDTDDLTGITATASMYGRVLFYSSERSYPSPGRDPWGASYNHFEGGGLSCVSVPTPDGLVGSLRIAAAYGLTSVSSGSYYGMLSFVPGGSIPTDLPFVSDGYWTSGSNMRPSLTHATGRIYQVHCTPFSLLIYLSGDYDSSNHSCLYFCIPKLLDSDAPAKISSVADNGSGLIRVVTASAHGLTTGNQIRLDAVSIDGSYSAYCSAQWTVTVIDTTTFDCQSSAYPGGTHDADTGVVSGTLGTSSCAVCFSNQNSNKYTYSFRSSFASTAWGSPYLLAAASYINGLFLWGGQRSAGTAPGFGLVMPCVVSLADSYTSMNPKSISGFAWLGECQMTWRSVGWNGDLKVIGLLWNMFVCGATVAGDTVKNNLDNYNWLCLTHNYTYGSVWTINGEP